jgi:predicted esterase YcpF (UPF0227 family)
VIIYIHGFGSSGLSNKASNLREYFKSQNIPYIAPSLVTNPNCAIKTLEELIENFDNVSLIGSSLGGYYAMYLAQKYNLKAVLINPAIHPYISLQKSIDNGINYYDLSKYEWNQSHVNILKSLKTDNLNQKDILLFLQKGDDVLDYKESIDFLPDSNMIIEEGGSHNFDDFDRYFKKVKEFLS